MDLNQLLAFLGERGMSGRRLAHYEVGDEISRGGMGMVYVAEDTKLARKVALKVLPSEMAESSERLIRFEREAKALAALNHPNIVTIHSVEKSEGIHFITMELVRGKTLREAIPEQGLALNELVDIAILLTDAMSVAHGQGITHRDLKPDNIMLSDEGRLKILDFGVAKLEQQSLEFGISAPLARQGTVDGKILGTVAYMSPEQAEGKRVDHRSDIFSIGVILYQMATGQRPFQGESTKSLLSAILKDEAALVTERRRDFPRDLGKIIERCLAKDREQRYQTAEDLGNELRKLERNVDSSAMTDHVAASPADSLKDFVLRPRDRQKSNIVVASVGTFLLTTLAIALVVLRLPSGRPDPPQSIYRQISFTGDAHSPVVSPDGQLVSYIAGSEEDGQSVVVHDVTSGGELRVLEDGHFGSMRWSHDGSSLLIHRFDTNRREAKTLIVPRIGGPSRDFPPHAFLSWSPDGSRFAGSFQNDRAISMVDVATAETTTIPLRGSFRWLYAIDWAPSGNIFLYVSGDNQRQGSIWTVSLNGEREKRVVNDVTPIPSARWSPNGEAIYYLREARYTKELWKVPVSPETGEPSGAPRPVLTGLQAGPDFDLSRDGKRISYTRETTLSNLWLTSLERSVQGAVASRKMITSGTLVNDRPSISPDGSRVAFSRGNAVKRNIYVVPIEGGVPQQLTFLESRNENPVWSPDGSEIAFGSTEGGVARVWRIPAAGGTPRPFPHTELSSNLHLAWSPASRILYQQPAVDNFQVLDPTSEDERPLLAKDVWIGSIHNVKPSPKDETMLARVHPGGGEYGLWSLPLHPSERQPTLLAGRPGFGLIFQVVDASHYRGMEIRLQARIKTDARSSWNGQLWLRGLGKDGHPTFNYKRDDRSIQSEDWRLYEAADRVDDEAQWISFGVFMRGFGRLWVDDVRLLVGDGDGNWDRLEVQNSGFELEGDGEKRGGWKLRNSAYTLKTTSEFAYEGENCLLIERPDVVPGDFIGIGWSEDGTAVYAYDRNSGAVVMIPVAGGAPATVIPALNDDRRSAVTRLTMTPDGMHFVYKVAQSQSDVWVLENFDPDL